MRVPCIQSVWFAREKGKEKKSSCFCTILSSLYSFQFGRKGKCWPYGELCIFPSLVPFLSQQIKDFSFPSYLFHPLLSLQLPFNQTYIYIYILNIFFPQCSLITVQNMEQFRNLQNLLFIYLCIFQRGGNGIHDEENEGCLCTSRVLIFLMQKKIKK